MFSPTCYEMDARRHLHGVLLLWIPCPGCPAVVDIPPIKQGCKLRVHGHLECTACGGDGGGKTNTLQGVSSSAQSLPAAPGWRLFARGVDWPERLWSQPCTDRKSTRLNSSHVAISYAVFCLTKKTQTTYINCKTT